MDSSRTLMDLFQPAKRLKTQSSSFPTSSPLSDSPKPFLCVPNKKLVSTLSPSSCKYKDQLAGADSSASSALTSEQISRIEFNQTRAKSKRNLRICSDIVAKCTTAKHMAYIKLEQLLVEQTWLEALQGELQKPYAQKLCHFVQSEICDSGVPIYPPQHLIFNALNTTPFDKIKVVIIGQDPYHGPGLAMGLSFSVPEGIKIPSSLLNVYKELQQDLQCSVPSHGNLQKWAVQGVLLLNAVLTVRKNQANSHAKKGWEQFTDAVIQTISQKKEGVIFLLWGNYAQVKSRLIDKTKHHILKAAHPSGLSAHKGFFNCRHFSRTNEILKKKGIPPIDWQI